VSLDCRTCGACCISDFAGAPAGYVALDAKDITKLSPRYRRMYVVDNIGRCLDGSTEDGMRLATKETKDGTVCVALRGSVGSRVSCAIYGRRPKDCSMFRVGGLTCLEARRVAGLGEVAT